MAEPRAAATTAAFFQNMLSYIQVGCYVFQKEILQLKDRDERVDGF